MLSLKKSKEKHLHSKSSSSSFTTKGQSRIMKSLVLFFERFVLNQVNFPIPDTTE